MEKELTMEEIAALAEEAVKATSKAIADGNTDIYAMKDFKKLCENGKDIRIDTAFSRNVGEKAAEYREYKTRILSVIESVASNYFARSDEKVFNKAVNVAYNAVINWHAGHKEPRMLSDVISVAWGIGLTDEEASAINRLEDKVLVFQSLQQYLKNQVNILFSSRDAALYFFCISKKLLYSLGHNKWSYEEVLDVISYFYEDALRVISGFVFREPDDTEGAGSDSVLKYIGHHANNVRVKLHTEETGISTYLSKHAQLIHTAIETYVYLHGKQPTIEEICSECGISTKVYFDALAAESFADPGTFDEQSVDYSDILNGAAKNDVTELIRSTLIGDERAYYILTHSKKVGLYEYLNLPGYTDTELGNKYGITCARVSQIKDAAIAKLVATSGTNVRDLLS